MKLRALVAGCLVVAAMCSTSPADAQTSPAPAPTLVAISPQVSGTDALRVELSAPNALASDMVRLAIFVRVTRAGVRQIADGTVVPSRTDYNVVSRRVSEVSDAARQTLVLTVPNDQLPQTPGIYPLRITVGASASLTTWLIRVGSTTAGDAPYALSLVVPFISTTALQPDRSTRLDTAERSRLAQIATLGETSPANAVTLLPNPETLNALDAAGPETRGVLSQLRSAFAARAVVPSTYVPLSIDSWRSADRDDHVALQFRIGREVTARMLARPAGRDGPTTAVLRPTDTPAALELLRREGIANVVVADSLLEPVRANAFPSPFAQTFRVRDSAGQDLLTASADSWLARAIVGIDRAPNAGEIAQHVLADLAAGFFDHAKLQRGSVVVMPDDWAPTERVVERLLRPMAASTLFRMVDLDRFFTTVTRANPDGEGQAESNNGPMRRTLTTTAGPDIAGHAFAVGAVRDTLESYATIFGPDTAPGIASYELALMASSDSRLSSAQRRAYTDEVADFVQRSLRAPDGQPAITTPQSERITLTTRQETLRLSITNALSTATNVRVELRSEKLDFPNGATMDVLLTPGENTVAFEVTVKTSGDSLLEYTVNAPGGSVGELAKGKLQVRSIALSGLGVALSAVALVVLLWWWVRHGMRSRRHRRLERVLAGLA